MTQLDMWGPMVDDPPQEQDEFLYEETIFFPVPLTPSIDMWGPMVEEYTWEVEVGTFSETLDFPFSEIIPANPNPVSRLELTIEQVAAFEFTIEQVAALELERD